MTAEDRETELPSPAFVDQFSYEVAWSEDQVRALLVAERVRADAAEGALRELVELKDLKQHIADLSVKGKVSGPALQRLYDDYQRRKPLAWERARAALPVDQKPQTGLRLAATEGVQHGEAK